MEQSAVDGLPGTFVAPTNPTTEFKCRYKNNTPRIPHRFKASTPYIRHGFKVMRLVLITLLLLLLLVCLMDRQRVDAPRRAGGLLMPLYH